MTQLIANILGRLFKAWLISNVAMYLRNMLLKKYRLEQHFNQSFSQTHSPDWKNIAWFAMLARHAYRTDAEIKKEFDEFPDIYINEIEEIKYIVISDHSAKTYYISVRGTTNSHNAIQNIRFRKDKSFRLGIELHTGFHRAAEIIADDLISRLDKDYVIYVTGHSLGGAIALIVAWYLDYSGFRISECVTFGQPKVTDSLGIRKMRGKINVTRVVNETDIVPTLAPEGTHRHRYAHLGTLIKLLDNGKYCYLEEPDSINFGINHFWLFAAEIKFSFYKVGKELPDHYMTRYQENIDKIIADGEEVPWVDRYKHIDDGELINDWS